MNNKVLLIDPGKGWGHFVSKIYSFRELSKQLGKKIIFLTKSSTQAKSYLEQKDFCEKVIYLSDYNRSVKSLSKKISNFLKDVKTIKELKVDSCYVFHPSLRYIMLANFAGIKNIYGLGKKLQQFFLKKNNKLYKSYFSEAVPGDPEARDFVKKLFSLKEIKFEPMFKSEEKKKDYVAIGIASSELFKRWPIDNYIKLIEHLYNNNFKKILIISGKDQKNDEEKIRNFFSEQSIDFVFTSDKKISEVMSYILKSKLYIGNDTGFAHLFINCSVKSYIIYGSCDPQYYSDLMNHIDHDSNIERSETSIYSITIEKVIKSIEKELVF